MDFFKENTFIVAEISRKRKEDDQEDIIEVKKRKIEKEITGSDEIIAEELTSGKVSSELDESKSSNEEKSEGELKTEKDKKRKEREDAVSKSPRKRLKLSEPLNEKEQQKKKLFIYGNYSQYYGYRNSHDPDQRLEILKSYPQYFDKKKILDVGCNSGFVTMEIAKQFQIEHIYGLDIDGGLINGAIRSIVKLKKKYPFDNPLKRENKFPYNITFKQGNYVLKDDCLLEIERPQFDLILCLSVTKWIHLNFGDQGLKQAFKRMFLHLNPGGILVLEAQEFNTYKRRKKLTEEIFKNFKAIKFYPKEFDAFLLSAEVGFSKMEVIAVPEHKNKGFKRPIKIFTKQ